MSLSLNLGQGSSNSDVLLPETNNLTDWLTQPTTDGKTLVNNRGTDAKLLNKNILSFDGNDDYVDLVSVPSEITTTGVFDIEFEIKFDSSATNVQRVFYFATSGNGYVRLQKNVSATSYILWARNSSSNDIFKSGSITYTADVAFKIKITGDGTNVVVKHDDTTKETISITTGNFEALTYNDIKLSGTGSSVSFKGKMANFKMTGGTTLHTSLPLQEGLLNKVYDVSGNGNHGTITNASRTTTDSTDVSSYNHQHGHNNTANFNGSSQYINLSNDSALTNIFEGTQLTDTSFVLDARIKFNAINTFQVIFSQNSNRGFLWRLSNAGQFQLFVGGGYVNTGVALTGLAVDQWIDTRLEYNSTGTTFTAKAKLAGDSAYTTLFTGSRAFQSLTGSDGVSVSVGGSLIFGMKENVGSGFVNHLDGQVQTIKVTNDNGVYFDCVSANSGVYNKITGTFIAAESTASGAGTATTLTNTRVPALINKTKQVMTFDGVDDKLVATGIASSDTITHDGTATLSAGTGEITSNAGTAYNIKVNGVLTFTGQSGIGTTIITSENSSIGNATATNIAALSSFWGTRVVDTSGDIVTGYYAGGNIDVTNPSGYVHNNSECKLDLVTTDLISTDILSINNSTATQNFSKGDKTTRFTSGYNLVNQLLQYSGTISGTSLTRTRTYVGE